MQTGYSGKDGNSPRYVCARAKQLYGGERTCQSIGGLRLEQAVLAELFTVLQPASLEATAKALAEAENRYQHDLAVFGLAVERARYEADRARRQYNAVEPENQLSPGPSNAPGKTSSPPSGKPTTTCARSRPASPPPSPARNWPGSPAPAPTSGPCSRRPRPPPSSASS